MNAKRSADEPGRDRAPPARARTGTEGLLDPLHGAAHFQHARTAPSPAIARFVELYWTVTWDLRGRAPYAQETLPWPCVNLVVGSHRPGLFGPATLRFVAELEGEGWVVGAKFRAGAYRPFLGAAVATLTDQEIPLDHAFGSRGAELERAMHTARPEDRVGVLEAFVTTLDRAEEPGVELAIAAAEIARTDRAILRVDALAERAGLSVRALQSLFHQHVGVSPKWVIRRFRVQDAAERIAREGVLDGAALASACGYFDQAHFIRDFKSQIGKTPGQYAAACARP
ncbi:MAG: helix-turn-helix transcriptional regulator [Polyangiaceae bacterium]